MANEPQNNKRKGPSGRQVFLTRRLLIIWGICALLAVAIIVMLVTTVTAHRQGWNSMYLESISQRQTIPPERGNILASDGSILATNLQYYDVVMDLRSKPFAIDKYVDSIPYLADTLAAVYPTRTAEQWRQYLESGIAKPKSLRSRCFVLARKVTYEQAQAFKKYPFFRHTRNSARTGLRLDPVTVRSYPFGEMAHLSIGRTTFIDSTAVDRHGYCGLEKALDSLLYGTPGVKKLQIGSRGTYMAVDTPAVNGCHVTTTIDITLQDILESELGEMLINANADWGTAMIMEVQTGDIKAISNLERDTLSRTPRYIEARNRTVEPVEPGSVMKVMSMAVALRYGYAHLSQVYSIGRSYAYLGRKPITDTHSPAQLRVDQFICYSSNIGMAKMSMPQYDSNCNLFRDRLAEMGFFDRFHTGISGECTPRFPTLQNNVGGRLSLSRMVFGYATQIPPLYTCAFYNAVANDGRFVRPRLVKALHYPDGRDSIIPVSYVRDRILSSEQAAELRRQIRSVVWEQGGTARTMQSPIVEIAAKTGTANIARELPKDSRGYTIKVPGFKGGYLQGHNRVAVCAFFPYENPRYTAIVVISDPKGAFRGAQYCCGAVIKNAALKMYARGMLDDNPEFRAQVTEMNQPLAHTSFQPERNNELRAAVGAARLRTFHRPSANYSQGQVPDVQGVSLREAVTHLESAGYGVDFEGFGYVDRQDPPAGTTASPGTIVRLSLKNIAEN